MNTNASPARSGVNVMLDAVIERLGVKNDAALARALDVAPPVISKLRHGRLPVGPSMFIRLHEESGFSIRELKRLLNASHAAPSS